MSFRGIQPALEHEYRSRGSQFDSGRNGDGSGERITRPARLVSMSIRPLSYSVSQGGIGARGGRIMGKTVQVVEHRRFARHPPGRGGWRSQVEESTAEMSGNSLPPLELSAMSTSVIRGPDDAWRSPPSEHGDRAEGAMV